MPFSRRNITIFECLSIVLFLACHQVVDPEPYYRDCLYDVCSCQVKLGECLCPTIAAYAKECSQKGVLVDWIPEVRECGKFIFFFFFFGIFGDFLFFLIANIR